MQRWMVALLAMAVLVGCGVPSTVRPVSTAQRVKAKDEVPMFSVTQGYTWQYKTVAHPEDDPYVDFDGTETMEIQSVRQEAGSTVLSMRAMDSYTDEYRYPVVTMTSDKVTIHGVEYLGVAAATVDDLTIDFLRFPLKTGSKWDDGLWIGEVKGQEQVTVGAGTYQAWKIGAIGTHDHAYTAVGTYWVAPGVGIVKSDLSIPGYNVESELASTTR
ncbi:MAG TPA: hypothetical protein V6D05_10940 [Stenomitos sp.]